MCGSNVQWSTQRAVLACHPNQVLWPSSLASETVSRGSKLAAVTSFHCSIGDFKVVVFSAAADADCANHRSIRIFEGYSAAKSCAAPRLLGAARDTPLTASALAECEHRCRNAAESLCTQTSLRRPFRRESNFRTFSI